MEFEYGPIPASRYEEVLHHLRYNFPDEPLNVSVGLCKHGKKCDLLEKLDLHTMQDGLSVMATDVKTGKIAGVALNGIARRGENEDALREIDASDNREYRLILGLLCNVNRDADLFNRYRVDKIFEIRILCVDSQLRGKGLAKELFMRSEILAEESGFRILKVDATSQFTQKICETFGFFTAKEVRYKDFKDEKGRMLYDTVSPHDFYKIMVKEVPPKPDKG